MAKDNVAIAAYAFTVVALVVIWCVLTGPAA